MLCFAEELLFCLRWCIIGFTLTDIICERKNFIMGTPSQLLNCSLIVGIFWASFSCLFIHASLTCSDSFIQCWCLHCQLFQFFIFSLFTKFFCSNPLKLYLILPLSFLSLLLLSFSLSQLFLLVSLALCLHPCLFSLIFLALLFFS